MASIPKQLAHFFFVEHIVISTISTLLAMYFIYGMYVLLFGTYLYMMRHREQMPVPRENRLYVWLAVALFILSTMFVVVYTIHLVTDSVTCFDALKTGDHRGSARYMTPTDNIAMVALDCLASLIPVLLNITADWLLIHRCYTIWLSDKQIGASLTVASVLINSFGLVGIIVMLVGLLRAEGTAQLDDWGNDFYVVYSIGSIAINFILTLLTGGRIWWIHRQVRVHVIHTSDRICQSVCRIVTVSGLLYPILQLVGFVAANASSMKTFPFDFTPIFTLSAGIAPTLAMVYCRLKTSFESLQTAGSSNIESNSQSAAHTINVAPTDVVIELRLMRA